MPLGDRRAILQPTAASGCLAPQLTGDRRGGSTEPAPDLLHGMTLYPEKRNLLAFHRRQIPPRERLCRGSDHRCSNQRRSPTKIDSVHRAPPQGADPVTAMAPVQPDPTAAFECSSQPPTPGCCDDRLNPP